LSKKQLCNKVESIIGNLFHPEFREGHSVLDDAKIGISQAGHLLKAAIRAANEGVDTEEGPPSPICLEIFELLTAYRDIVNRTLEAAQGEEMRRSSAGAGEAA
jgi:hypothetical protein